MHCVFGMFTRMASAQLAIRFTERQLATLDALAAASNSTRSAVVKQLVDDAERTRVAASYATAYPTRQCDVDDFGDLDAFRDDAERERVEGRAGESTW